MNGVKKRGVGREHTTYAYATETVSIFMPECLPKLIDGQEVAAN
jgi:hypothetical protein